MSRRHVDLVDALPQRHEEVLGRDRLHVAAHRVLVDRLEALVGVPAAELVQDARLGRDQEAAGAGRSATARPSRPSRAPSFGRPAACPRDSIQSAVVVHPHSGWIEHLGLGILRPRAAAPVGRCPRARGTRPSTGASCARLCRSTWAPRNTSGRNRISRSSGIVRTTSTAFEDVQQMSDSALTSADGVHVGDHRRAGMLGLPRPQLVGGDRRGQRAARLERGQQHGLLGREQLRGLRHEVHAAEHDDLGVGGRRPCARAPASRPRSPRRPGSTAPGSCAPGSRPAARRPAAGPRPPTRR